jgi:hypothetical protein
MIPNQSIFSFLSFKMTLKLILSSKQNKKFINGKIKLILLSNAVEIDLVNLLRILLI